MAVEQETDSRGYFTAEKFVEEDGSVTPSLDEMDLVENAESEEKARIELAKSILEYANEYYENYEQYRNSPNRRRHLPFIDKALELNNPAKIEENILCREGGQKSW